MLRDLTLLKGYFVAFLIVLLDQLSKYLVQGTSLVVTNTGAAFGLFKGARVFLVIVSVIAVIVVIKYFKFYPFALGLLLGGTLGNLIDRVVHGFVIDFIDVGFWPVFNIADSANTIGFILLALVLMKE